MEELRARLANLRGFPPAEAIEWAALGAMLDSLNETKETSPAADGWQFGERRAVAGAVKRRSLGQAARKGRQ
jgi:hypothetical protein